MYNIKSWDKLRTCKMCKKQRYYFKKYNKTFNNCVLCVEKLERLTKDA